MDITQLAAIIFAIIALGVVGFQVALALGAPWGTYAMGGVYPGRFPPAMRVAAVVQAVFIALLAVVVLSAADLAWPALVDAQPWLMWVPVIVSTVSLGLNAISRSAGERRIWVPAAVLMLATSLIVVVTASN